MNSDELIFYSNVIIDNKGPNKHQNGKPMGVWFNNKNTY